LKKWLRRIRGEKTMPRGDGTGPWWVQDRNWKCNRPTGFGRSAGWGYPQRYQFEESTPLTKDEQKKIVEDKLKTIEKEKDLLEKQLKECDS
jgi:hypothetical protein